MASLAPRRMTLDEFLEWDDGTDTRYELIEGAAVAMAPAMPDHAAIVTNLARALGGELRAPCFVLVGAGVIRPDRAGHFYVPDLLATCVPVPRGSRHVPAPRLIVEVLSPSTRRVDRDVKLDGYRAIPTVEEILLVWSEERRAQLWRRDGERWIVEDLIGDAQLRLASVESPIGLGAIYQNVPLEPAGETG
jgi:Uma2 family endonuclease